MSFLQPSVARVEIYFEIAFLETVHFARIVSLLLLKSSGLWPICEIGLITLASILKKKPVKQKADAIDEINL